MNIAKIKNQILSGIAIKKEEALYLLQEASMGVSAQKHVESNFLEKLCQSADEIRQYFCGNVFDMCAVINGKSGKCSENCKFCAQSSFYDTNTPYYPLLKQEQIIEQLNIAQSAGLKRCALVNSGKKASQRELHTIAHAFECFTQDQENSKMHTMSLCASLGLLDKEDFLFLQAHGLSGVHNNLETSSSYFPNVCTSHNFEEKIASIQAAQSCDLMVCSGGIFGLGESVEDRIELAFSLKELGITSVPMNILFPIQGTPFQENKPLSLQEIRALIAVYRFILPQAFIRLAGGRTLLADKGESLFKGGANAMISGNMLTIAGFSIKDDIEMIRRLGFDV